MKSILRAIKYQWLWRSSQILVNLPVNFARDKTLPPMSFIVGCGRSGTTILGQLFQSHPEVKYIFEPYHLWHTIDRQTDVLNLYEEIEAKLLMNESDYSPEIKSRFDILIRNQAQSHHKTVLEKTPLNAFRLNYLEKIAPQSKYIHIVRDGVNVCDSINKLATINSYKIMGKPDLNQWWGINDAKWKSLRQEGIARGYYAEEVSQLTNNWQKGAYEWLLSLQEVEKRKAQLHDRFLEITYSQFTENPANSLTKICNFLGLTCPQSWLQSSASQVKNKPQPDNPQIFLPPQMCADFNLWQEKYNFVNTVNKL